MRIGPSHPCMKLGCLAASLAVVLLGKDKPIYAPCCVHASILPPIPIHSLPSHLSDVYLSSSLLLLPPCHADKIAVTGDKIRQKTYRWHTGYIGGLKERTLKDQMAKDPKEVIRKAVLRMLPRNRLVDPRMTKLRIFEGGSHPFEDIPAREEAKPAQLPHLLPPPRTVLYPQPSLFLLHAPPSPQPRMTKLRIFEGDSHPFGDMPVREETMPLRNVREMRPRERRAADKAARAAAAKGLDPAVTAVAAVEDDVCTMGRAALALVTARSTRRERGRSSLRAARGHELLAIVEMPWDRRSKCRTDESRPVNSAKEKAVKWKAG
ncbi:unnamed protein product [Closterium sp. NIES-65]|nr:unnamed protein product [Closterium sp. NIES-65]